MAGSPDDVEAFKRCQGVKCHLRKLFRQATVQDSAFGILSEKIDFLLRRVEFRVRKKVEIADMIQMEVGEDNAADVFEPNNLGQLAFHQLLVFFRADVDQRLGLDVEEIDVGVHI